jgi:hypothetical protein
MPSVSVPMCEPSSDNTSPQRIRELNSTLGLGYGIEYKNSHQGYGEKLNQMKTMYENKLKHINTVLSVLKQHPEWEESIEFTTRL